MTQIDSLQPGIWGLHLVPLGMLSSDLCPLGSALSNLVVGNWPSSDFSRLGNIAVTFLS